MTAAIRRPQPSLRLLRPPRNGRLQQRGTMRTEKGTEPEVDNGGPGTGLRSRRGWRGWLIGQL